MSDELIARIRDRDPKVRVAAIVEAGKRGDASLAAIVAEHLDGDDKEARKQAALTLGALRATQFAPRLVARLATERDLVFGAFVAAIERMGTRDAVPGLVAALRDAPDEHVWDLTHALWVLTGVDPASDAGGQRGPARADWLRKTWLRAADARQLDAPPPPSIRDIHPLGADLASFTLAFGRNQVRIDDDPTPPGSTWPRWFRSLRIGDVAVYGVGSTCSTCELRLRQLGWAEAPARDAARALETTGADDLRTWIDTWTPLIGGLRSGRYLAARLGFAVERIDEARASSSWFHRRTELRGPDAEPGEPADNWIGTVHYQGPRVGAPPTFPVIVPSQDPATLHEPTVDAYRDAIARGARPPVATFAWVDERSVEMEWEERFLAMVVLNGHHRLEAYVRARIAPPIIALARIDDSWGPPERPDAYLREAFAALTPA